MALLWKLCKRGHPQMPHNVQFECNRSYIQRQCKLCRSEINRQSWQRRKAKQEWLNQNFVIAPTGRQIPARRTAADTGQAKAAVVVSAVEANASRKANALH